MKGHGYGYSHNSRKMSYGDKSGTSHLPKVTGRAKRGLDRITKPKKG